MPTKKFGVSIAQVEEFRNFQISLLKRKFHAVDKMDYIDLVQLTTELWQVPTIQKVTIANHRLYVGDSLIIRASAVSSKMIQGNVVTLPLKKIIFPVGSSITFSFLSEHLKNNFIEALGEVGGPDDERWDNS